MKVLLVLVAATLANGAFAASTCLGRCGDNLDNSHNCQCNTHCKKYGDCCSDYDLYCVTGSCKSRCDTWDNRYPCNCDAACQSKGDCCSDYSAQCKTDASCLGKCNAKYDPSKPCQCNTLCSKYGNCCSDYTSLCAAVPKDISEFASTIWAADTNRGDVGSDIVVNHGNYISSSNSKKDVSPSRLFTSVESQVLERPTFKALTKLFNNYITTQGTTETKTSTEQAEEDEFMNAIFNTAVMQQAYQFVKAKNYFSGTLSEYKEFIRNLLFKHYSRKATRDTSGFEHVFVGEFSSSSAVSGFHNWVRLYQLEKDGHANYHGYLKKLQPNLVKFQFKWSGRVKPITSIMIGASPEFEIALFSTCFLKAPNSVCKLKINGNSADIQTYDYKGDKVFGSAYFVA